MAEHTKFEKLVAEAKKSVTKILPQDAVEKLKSGEAVIVDVREQDEWDEEHIPGAIHISRGTIELDIEEKVPDTNAMISLISALAAVRRLRPSVYENRG